jgi:hypothetical protein
MDEELIKKIVQSQKPLLSLSKEELIIMISIAANIQSEADDEIKALKTQAALDKVTMDIFKDKIIEMKKDNDRLKKEELLLMNELNEQDIIDIISQEDFDEDIYDEEEPFDFEVFIHNVKETTEENEEFMIENALLKKKINNVYEFLKGYEKNTDAQLMVIDLADAINYELEDSDDDDE